ARATSIHTTTRAASRSTTCPTSSRARPTTHLPATAKRPSRAMRLHVHEWGDPDAPPLVCVHGVTGHGERFKRLAEERWSAHHHVLAPDLRGHGRSGYD